MALGVRLLLAHEMIGVGGQEARDGCEFASFFSCARGSTPQELLRKGIYDKIAVALKGGAWREASMVLMGQALAEAPPRRSPMWPRGRLRSIIAGDRHSMNTAVGGHSWRARTSDHRSTERAVPCGVGAAAASATPLRGSLFALLRRESSASPSSSPGDSTEMPARPGRMAHSRRPRGWWRREHTTAEERQPISPRAGRVRWECEGTRPGEHGTAAITMIGAPSQPAAQVLADYI